MPQLNEISLSGIRLRPDWWRWIQWLANTPPPLPATSTNVQCNWLGAPAGSLTYKNPAAAQPWLDLAGTDLGFSFAHGGQSMVLFGDTWPTSSWTNDDVLATFTGTDACPTLTFPSVGNKPKNIAVLDGTKSLPMGALHTPVAGFSTVSDAYGIFNQGLRICKTVDDCGWGDRCELVGGNKLCVVPDETGAVDFYRAAPLVIGRMKSIASAEFEKVASLSQDEFGNVAARLVPHFDPDAMDSNVYAFNPALSMASQATKPAVLVWAKPSFGSLRRAPETYFLYFDLTASDPWTPRTYIGKTSVNKPFFFATPAGSHSLGGVPIIQSADETYAGKPILLPAQMSMAFIPGYNRWVMLYGGRWAGVALSMTTDTNQGIFMRVANHPWGPWSAPKMVWSAASSTAYSTIMYHPTTNPSVADKDLSNPTPGAIHPFRTAATDYGAEYGASILDTVSQGYAGGAHLYWAMSTFNPYRVVVMHTQLTE